MIDFLISYSPSFFCGAFFAYIILTIRRDSVFFQFLSLSIISSKITLEGLDEVKKSLKKINDELKALND